MKTEDEQDEPQERRKFRISYPVMMILGFVAGVFFTAMFWLATARPIIAYAKTIGFEQSPAVILSARLDDGHNEESSAFDSVIEVTYEFQVDGERHVGDEFDIASSLGMIRSSRASKFVQSHPPGTEMICHYDPDDPSRSLLRRGLPRWTLMGSCLYFWLCLAGSSFMPD